MNLPAPTSYETNAATANRLMKQSPTVRAKLQSLSRWEWMGLALCLALFLAQVTLSSREKSAAFDEQYHLAAGYAYLKTGDFRLSRTVGHPPLANLLNALPLLFRSDIQLPFQRHLPHITHD